MPLTPAALNRFQKAAALQANEQATGGTIYISGTAYKVAVVPSRGVLELTSGGYVQARTIEIVARDSVLPLSVLVDTTLTDRPLKPVVITYDHADYQLKNVITDPTGFQHHITAVERHAVK